MSFSTLTASSRRTARAWMDRVRGGRGLAGTFAILVLAGFHGLPASAGEPPKELRKARLFVLYSSTLFSGVNKNDALAALKLWVQTIGRNRGFLLETEADAFDRLEEADRRIQENTADLLILNTIEYLRSTQTEKLDAEFVAGHEHATELDDYVVVARREQNLAGIGNLRGKNILFYKSGAEWGRVWVDDVLGEMGLGSIDDFFGSNSEFIKPSSVILPVFFGKSDACVAKRSSLATMAEMNPQLAARLQALTNSPSLPDLVVCVHKNFKVFHDDLLQGLAELHTEPKGQQVLMLFKIDKLEQFRPQYLDAARDLLARQAKLKPSAPQAGAIAVSGGKP